MSRVISQREARRLRKRVESMERAFQLQRRAWSQEYIHGVHIATVRFEADELAPVAVRTARKLGHAVVVAGDEDGVLKLIALKHPQESVS